MNEWMNGWVWWLCVGSWLHSGYHLTTSIVAPALLTLPYSFRLLGWVGGMVCLTLAGLITFYSYNLLSSVLDHHAQLGHRQLRLRDLTRHVLGTCNCLSYIFSFFSSYYYYIDVCVCLFINLQSLSLSPIILPAHDLILIIQSLNSIPIFPFKLRVVTC